MYNVHLVRVTSIAFLIRIPSIVLALTLPNIPCNVTKDFLGDHSRRPCAADLLDLASFLNTTESDILLGPARDFRPAEFRIPKTGKRLLYSKYSLEMPNFDDVADMIDQAEDELEKVIERDGGRALIGKVQGWNFGTAHLSIQTRYDGMNNRSLLQYLKALRMSGFVYGFFEVQIVFWDDDLTVRERATGVLKINAPR